MSKNILITLLLALILSSVSAQDINLFNEFQKVKSEFEFLGLNDISTHRYYVTYGDSCLLKNRDTDVLIPELDYNISNELEQNSSLFEGKGHLLSLTQFNENIMFVIIAIHGHYATPSALLFAINEKGQIVDEIKVASVFFDAGNGSVTRSQFENRNILKIISKNLDERPEGQPCQAEIKTYMISETGKILLSNTESKEIVCEE